MCYKREAAYEEDYKGFQIRIEYDENAESPRQWLNLGTMICEHSRYDLGDGEVTNGRWVGGVDYWMRKEAPVLTIKEGDEYVDLEPKDAFMAFVQRKDVVALPLFLLDHSGLWMRTGRFAEDSGGWDTSMVGYIYATKETIKKEYGKAGKKEIAKALEVLRGEVAVYSDYLSGNAYGYRVLKDGEEVDSVWGFVGDSEKGGCLDQAKSYVDWAVKDAKKKKGAR